MATKQPKIAPELTPEEQDILEQITSHRPNFFFTHRESIGMDGRTHAYSLEVMFSYMWKHGSVNLYCSFPTRDHLRVFEEGLNFENYTSNGVTNARGEAKIWSWGGE